MTSTNAETLTSSSAQRSNSLEKHLQQRPHPQDLKDKHILLDTSAAPSLQSTQQELERRIATDNLKKSLAARPDRSELADRNILSTSATIAPALESPSRELAKHMRRDSLEKALQNRPNQEKLVREGILNEEVAGSD